MPFTPETLEEKPYNRCITCEHLGIRCDGPNFLAMSAERWCEWCRIRKEKLKWTNVQLAEFADVSKTTVERVMAGRVDDLRRSTMQLVTKALINGTWGQYPCANTTLAKPETVYVDNPEHMEKAAAALSECARLQEVLNNINTEHRADLVAAHDADQRKIDHLKEEVKFMSEQLTAKDKQLSENYGFMRRKDKINVCLAILLALAVLVILAALIYDKINPYAGFFWLEPRS